MKYRISHVHFGHVHFGFLAAAVFALSAAGCDSQTVTPDASQTQENHDGHAHHDHGDHAHGEGGNTEQALAKLSPADRAAVEKQKICPVSGDKLGEGSMGVPLKVLVSGREVWICCEGCRESLEENPDDYLAKLPK